MATATDHIKWFRDSSPYIDAHRGKTFVVHPGGDALDSDNLPNMISDIALLNSLGVHLVIVFGAAPQIDRALREAGHTWQQGRGTGHDTGHDTGHKKPDIRVTSPDLIAPVVGVVGTIRATLEAQLGKGLTNSPVRGNEIATASGNYVKARPLGVVDGVDFQKTGTVRRINHRAIAAHLAQENIVLIGPLGYSPSGEIFNLSSRELARDVAVALHADKLIYLTLEKGIQDRQGRLMSEIDLSTINSGASANTEIPAETPPHLQALISDCREACHQGVARCHIISYEIDGAILEELFTRDGCGTQIVGHSYEQIRDARADDVGGILKLIEPLEAAGMLVKRSRELLESEIDRFVVIERDGLLISCAALYRFDHQGELACLVTHPDYRNGDRGDRLLDRVEKKARDHALTHLFVLTTQSTHWFRERGFVETDLDALPEEKQAFYNNQRGAGILSKPLSRSP